MALRYCFEEEYVRATLARSRPSDLAVIDIENISPSIIRSAVDRGVFVYGYINAGALEGGRTYYQKFKHLRLEKYDGWDGEYWIDPTAREWRDHIVELGKAIRATGAIGVYFDNADIYYEVRHIKQEYSRDIPSQTSVYQALCGMICNLTDLGLIVMPNGGDTFVRRFYTEYPTRLHTINQEGALYEDFKRQPRNERKYRAEYMDWAKKKGLYVRGIEYCKKAYQIAECKAYYKLHGWQGLYISKHKYLKGD